MKQQKKSFRILIFVLALILLAEVSYIVVRKYSFNQYIGKFTQADNLESTDQYIISAYEYLESSVGYIEEVKKVYEQVYNSFEESKNLTEEEIYSYYYFIFVKSRIDFIVCGANDFNNNKFVSFYSENRSEYYAGIHECIVEYDALKKELYQQVYYKGDGYDSFSLDYIKMYANYNEFMSIYDRCIAKSKEIQKLLDSKEEW